MQVYEELIKEIGKGLEIDTTVDKKMACRLNFKEAKVTLQIDLLPDGERMMITSEIGEVPEGHFRERFFRAALKFNGVHQNRPIFAFSEKKNVMVAFRIFQINATTAPALIAFIKLMVADTKSWSEQLTRGEVPHIEGTVHSSGSLFGLTR